MLANLNTQVTNTDRSRSTLSPLSFNLFGLSSYPSSSHLNPSHRQLQPEKWQSIQLWQAFVQNVDPVVKLLHLPTLQLTMYSAIDKPEEAPVDVRCLMYAIYFAATISLDPDETARMLGQRKSAALDQFRAGLELSLASSTILETPTVTGLQALSIYLVSRCIIYLQILLCVADSQLANCSSTGRWSFCMGHQWDCNTPSRVDRLTPGSVSVRNHSLRR
jgi:hypothetical protein